MLPDKVWVTWNYLHERVLWHLQGCWLVQVPISVVHKKGAVALDGTDALVLHVYGAYGIPSDADFDATRLGLLDR